MACPDRENGGYSRIRILTLVSSPAQELFLKCIKHVHLTGIKHERHTSSCGRWLKAEGKQKSFKSV